MKKLNILFLCNKPKQEKDASTIIDHIHAFEEYSKHNIYIHSGVGNISNKLDLNLFDVIVIHYSIYIPWDNYIDSHSKQRIREFEGLKVIFIQDEYRRIHLMMETLNYLGIDVLFTCFQQDQIEKVYPSHLLPGISKYTNLTGYLPESLREMKDIPLTHERKIHVGYRARKIPYVLGRLSFEKYNIVDQWKIHSERQQIEINSNLSYEESKRFYGSQWIEFLTSCKTTLGVESGASVMDFTGELEISIQKYLNKNPSADFEEVHDKFLKEHEGQYYLNQISPRCFEAILLKTGLVLFEGHYSGILKPWKHYIPLKKDFSNFLEVINLIKQDEYIQEMVDRTYEDIGCNELYKYSTFIKNVDDIIENEFENRSKIKKNISLNFKDIFETIDLVEKSLAEKIKSIIKDYFKIVKRILKKIYILSQGFKHKMVN